MTILDTVCSGFVRLRAFSNACVNTFVNALFCRILFDFRNWVGNFHTNGAIHSSPSIEAYANSVCTQTVVRATVRAQFNFASCSSKSGFALALSGSFVAHSVFVAIVWASADVAGGSAPRLGTVLARFAVTFTSHSVARTVARAVFRALFVTAVSSKKVCMASACAVHT